MKAVDKRDRLDFLASLVAEQIEHFSPVDRARIYEGLSLICDGEAAKTAAFAALTIRKSEAAQLKFRELLKP
jgi:hypothetical protein